MRNDSYKLGFPDLAGKGVKDIPFCDGQQVTSSFWNIKKVKLSANGKDIKFKTNPCQWECWQRQQYTER